MVDSQNSFLKRKDLIAGELFVGDATIRTVLGSCIAVCIWDRQQKYGGMIHFLLPEDMSHKDDRTSNRYGCTAILNLLRKFKDQGSDRNNLEAKILGGASLIADTPDYDVGAANIKCAEEELAKFGINIVARHVGGKQGREIIFDTTTGEVKVRLIKGELLEPPKKIRREEAVHKNNKKIRVLIIDDSTTFRAVLRKKIEESSDFEVMAEANGAREAEKIRAQSEPDVITLDLHMPEMDGVTYLKQYIKKRPTPTILVTAAEKEDAGPVIQGLEHGAFDYVKKIGMAELRGPWLELQDKIRAASQARSAQAEISSALSLIVRSVENARISERKINSHLVLIGSSTGGTEALRVVLRQLPEQFPPILIVQHMPPGFTSVFSESLNQECRLTVKEAANGDIVSSNHVYIAPGGFQMAVKERGDQLVIVIKDDPPLKNFKPSVDYLFKSVALSNKKKVLAAILTGMGEDGSDGMVQLHNKGAQTIAQDEKTSLIFSMPSAAIKKGAVDHVAALSDVPRKMVQLLS